MKAEERRAVIAQTLTADRPISATALADSLIKIPMAGRVESLNAAIAASVLMFEAARQRRACGEENA